MLNDSLSVCRVVLLHQGPDRSGGAEDQVSWHSSPSPLRDALTPDQLPIMLAESTQLIRITIFATTYSMGIKRALQVGFDHATPLVSFSPKYALGC